MLRTVRKTTAAAAALGALALGGAAIAGAADKNAAPGGSGSPQTRPQREALSSSVAAKVKAAALKKVPGATVLRTEGGGPYGTPYHAHIRISGGDEKVVLVNASFVATAVQDDKGRGGPGGRHGRGGPGGPRGDEKPLTGDTKTKVEAAVKATYAGAKIERTETNGDSAAPYESHITTSAGKHLEVLVSKDFKVVEAREHPARP